MRLALVRSSLSILACAIATLGALPSATAQPQKPVATVNGKQIPAQRLEDVVNQLSSQGRPDTPDLRAAVKEQLIIREIFAQEAESRGLAKSADLQRQLEQMREDLLIRALISDYLSNVDPVSEDDVRKEYQRQHGAASSDKEYRARHILVDREEEARQVIAQLRKGERFETLAKRSRDPGSAQQGGDLDWATPDSYVKEFAEAMVALEKGKFTDKPVKTQFGFHVIRLDDVRAVTPPSIAQVGPQIRQELERSRIDKLQQALRAKAKVQP